MTNAIGFIAELRGNESGSLYLPSFKPTTPYGFELSARFVKEIYSYSLSEQDAWVFILWRKPPRKGPHRWMTHSRGNMGGDESLADSWVKCIRWQEGNRHWTAGWHVFTSEQDAREKMKCYISDVRWAVTKVRVRGIRYLIQQPVMDHPVWICEEMLVPFPERMK